MSAEEEDDEILSASELETDPIPTESPQNEPEEANAEENVDCPENLDESEEPTGENQESVLQSKLPKSTAKKSLPNTTTAQKAPLTESKLLGVDLLDTEKIDRSIHRSPFNFGANSRFKTYSSSKKVDVTGFQSQSGQKVITNYQPLTTSTQPLQKNPSVPKL